MAGLVLAAGVVLAIGPPTASADGPSIWVDDPVPGTVTVQGDGWSGEGGVWLYQCGGYPDDEDEFWQNCDHSSGIEVTQDPPWNVTFDVVAIVDPGAQEPFPPGTVNAMGNGTADCEVAGAGCGLLAIEGEISDLPSVTHAWAMLEFASLYGPPTIDVSGTTSELRDGDAVTVASSGHRPGTAAMTYLCVGAGPAYPGGCDPVAGSLVTIDGTGGFSEPVELPRFVWNNDPLGNSEWYDCADGCSAAVVSAGNLLSPYSSPITFARTDVEQHPSVLSVTKVLVNKYGAINVTGLVDCGSALGAWGLDDVAVAGGNISWTARQPIGRKGVVTAHYESAIASICHDPAKAGPYPWGTHPPVTSPDVWWVYPDSGGKFAAGNVTITVRYDGGVWGGWWGAENYLLTGASQWNVKAVSVKR
jgi:hypothetical protein